VGTSHLDGNSRVRKAVTDLIDRLRVYLFAWGKKWSKGALRGFGFQCPGVWGGRSRIVTESQRNDLGKRPI